MAKKYIDLASVEGSGLWLKGPGGGLWEADSIGLYKDPQILWDSSRLLDKIGILIFVCGGAHEYTINAVFTPYLNL